MNKYEKIEPFLQEDTNKYNELLQELQKMRTFVHYSDEFCTFLYLTLYFSYIVEYCIIFLFKFKK